MVRVQRVGEWLHAEVGADRVMMNVASGNYIGLTPVGARIWDLLDHASTIDDVCAALVRQYDVEAAICRVEVQAFLADLARLGAVTVDPAIA